MKELTIDSNSTFGYGGGDEYVVGVEAVGVYFKCLFEGFIGQKVDDSICNGHQGGAESLEERAESFLIIKTIVPP